MSHPTHNLLRAYVAPDAAELRAAGDGPDILAGHFAVWGQWTEINSRYEGHFLERIAPGAFDRSIAGRSPKVLFDHGNDPSIGNKLLGSLRSLASDDAGMAYEVELYDAGYVNDLKPGLRNGDYGASFRFSVAADGDEWVTPSRASDHNPEKLPERTLTDVDLFEFGPVTFPAYAGATAGMRSTTDEFIGEMLRDPLFVARLTERMGALPVQKMLAELPEDLRAATPEPAAVDDPDEAHSRKRLAFMARHNF